MPVRRITRSLSPVAARSGTTMKASVLDKLKRSLTGDSSRSNSPVRRRGRETPLDKLKRSLTSDSNRSYTMNDSFRSNNSSSSNSRRRSSAIQKVRSSLQGKVDVKALWGDGSEGNNKFMAKMFRDVFGSALIEAPASGEWPAMASPRAWLSKVL